MSHEDVYGYTYNGTDQAVLDRFACQIAKEHTDSHGYYHSVTLDYDVRPGAVSRAAFQSRNLDGDGDFREVAQRIYADEDVQTKSVVVKVEVASVAECVGQAFEANDPLVAKAMGDPRITKLVAAGWSRQSSRPDNTVHAMGMGGLEVTGMTYKSETDTTPFKTGYYLKGEQRWLNQTGPFASMAEAKKKAREILEANPMMGAVTIEKISRRESGAAAAVVRAIPKKMFFHVLLTMEHIKPSAKPKGWAVVMDCHH